MSGHVLYSTNVYLKLHIQERFRNDLHYVWCSEIFDSKTASKYSTAALVAPSSNPADIYRELRRDVEGRDTHSAKIAAQKLSFQSLATTWAADGEISNEDRDDIFFLATTATFDLWRPIVYVIPRDAVASRLQRVAASRCAGIGPEYIIAELKRDEFDTIEV